MLEKIEKARFEATMTVASMKNNKLPVGAVVTLLSRRPQTTKQDDRDVITDILFVDIDGERKSMPLAEIHRLKLAAGSAPLVKEEGEFVELATKFTIRESKDRLGNDGEPVYVPAAYNAADKFFVRETQDVKRISYQELIASKLKAGHKYDPVQDYTIEVMS